MFEFLPWEDQFYFKAIILSSGPPEGFIWTVDGKQLLDLYSLRPVWWVLDV